MTKLEYSDDEPTWASSYLLPELLKILARDAPPPARVLEIGCGNGATARTLEKLGYDVTAIDPSASGIEQARRHETPTLRFAAASTDEDLSHLGTFSIVISLEVIEHCPSARAFAGAFRARLEPGGIGIISTPYHGYLKTLAVVASGRFDSHFDPLWEGGHLKFFTNAKLRQLFAETGFESVQLHRVGRIPIMAKSVIAVVR
jgi:2-polyprenyl-6-hydroxyphenyl methylase/3-demethylubiquinone-9 3-methyltransferase